MTSEKLIDYISYSLLILSVLLLKLKDEYLENIINGKSFAFISVSIGIALGGCWMFFLYKKKSTYFKGPESRQKTILSQFFSIVVLTIFFSAFYNFDSGKDDKRYQKAFIDTKSTNVMYGIKYVHLILNGKRERFNPPNEEFAALVEKDSVLLTIGQGKLGYEFIISFSPVSK